MPLVSRIRPAERAGCPIHDPWRATDRVLTAGRWGRGDAVVGRAGSSRRAMTSALVRPTSRSSRSVIARSSCASHLPRRHRRSASIRLPMKARPVTAPSRPDDRPVGSGVGSRFARKMLRHMLHLLKATNVAFPTPDSWRRPRREGRRAVYAALCNPKGDHRVAAAQRHLLHSSIARMFRPRPSGAFPPWTCAARETGRPLFSGTAQESSGPEPARPGAPCRFQRVEARSTRRFGIHAAGLAALFASAASTGESRPEQGAGLVLVTDAGPATN